MAVTVITGEYSDGTPATGDFYAKANHFFEKDGHLNLVDNVSTQNAVAIYKPGSWMYAFAGEKLARRSGEGTFVSKGD